LKNNGEIKKLH